MVLNGVKIKIFVLVFLKIKKQTYFFYSKIGYIIWMVEFDEKKHSTLK